jgi:lipoprotein signal peptidase
MGNPFQQIATLWTEILPLLSEPARDLSNDDAFELMMYLVGTGDITLFDKLVKDKSGNITSHKPGVQTRIVPVIAGIPFLKARGSNPGPNGSLGATQQQYFAPTPAFAIVLYKLAKLLANDWGATQIVYGGIGAGGNANVTDCHSTGHCVDFYGANTKRGNFDVRQDWWMRPVYDSAGNLHASEGNGWAMDRWKNETKTYYRLAMSPEPQDAVACDFFAAVYEFAYEETRAEAFDASPHSFAFGLPLSKGWIMHPDYPEMATPGRRSHNDHIHFQLGKTR